MNDDYKSRLVSEAADHLPVFDLVTANTLPPRSLSRQCQHYFRLQISNLVGVGMATGLESVGQMLNTHNV